MRTRISYFAVVVLLLGVVSTGVGLVIRHQRSHAQIRAIPFSKVSNQIFYTGDGKATIHAVIKKYVRSDGSYKQITLKDGQPPSVLYSITGWGVFGVRDEDHMLVFRSPKHHAFHPIDEAALRKDPTFVGEDTILGYRVLVQRFPGSKPGEYDEECRAPALDGALLRDVSAGASGNRDVMEAVSITLGEPDPNEFGNLPNYPIDYGPYLKDIQLAEARGDRDEANKMRSELEEQKAIAKTKGWQISVTLPPDSSKECQTKGR